ncbi:CARDB domain-containing protein [Bacillus cereus]|uniref:CARDB domain-containing protein n=1 Tax=Bacillus cereus TaxID=1396 RepID=UPI000BF68FB9|nr:CARDB domain-containing protein [Bacillus cereus]PFI78827.1 hypothetical protein COI83_26785 [Bacillus cereus]
MDKRVVGLKIPKNPLFVGSYVEIPVIINPKSKIRLEDLDFDIPSREGGTVSLSRDKFFNSKTPSIMLCVGYNPGKYVLRVLKKGTNTVLGESKFRINALWKKKSAGPSLSFTGINEGYLAASAWGGGPNGPQNINTFPALGTRRIAILLVDTSSQRYSTNTTDLQNHRDRWLNETVNGVTTGGVTRSVAHYYREVSYGNLDITAEVFGPVQLPGSWDDYFNPNGIFKGSYPQACITAGDGIIDFSNFDTLLCVSQSVDATPATPLKSAWPYSSIGNWGPYTTGEGNKTIGIISMPNEWGLTSDREIHETLSHEIGHNLRLNDQYAPVVAGRNLGSWEMMAWDDPLPHFTMVHRMMLGWIKPEEIKSYNFTSGTPVDETITLHPIEQGSPPTGRHTGIEIRIADGWNYYFEYRVGQSTQIGDRLLPIDNRVLGTDVVSPPWTPPIQRPNILLLNNDADGDGSVLGNGQDYEETDNTDPVFPADLHVNVSNIDGTKADLRVQYGINNKPDPSIRPWPAGPGREWQSPDIEIRNVRNQADHNWWNVPWEGNDNTVVARVKNNGTLDAPSVRVNFYVKDYTIGNGTETFLGSDVRDIPAGLTVEFNTSWVPPIQGHYCIVVRIPLYTRPGIPPVTEMTELNNIAQSNYNRFISRTASPATREVTSILVENPYELPTRVFIVPGQTNPLYRTYIEHTWLVLKPGETKKVKVMFEYTGGEKHQEREYKLIPNMMNIVGFIEDPREKPHTAQVFGGAQVQVVTGRATEFKSIDIDNKTVRGSVVTIDDGNPVPDGKIILILSSGTGKSEGKTYQMTEISNGNFSARIRHECEYIEAYFTPPIGYADCTSQKLKLEN